jgi:hypothetical protein
MGMATEIEMEVMRTSASRALILRRARGRAKGGVGVGIW